MATPHVLDAGSATVSGPVRATRITEQYARLVARDTYFWAWTLSNVYNRRRGFEGVKEPGRLGGALPAAPPNRITMLTDYILPSQREVCCPNQDVVYGAGPLALDLTPVVVQVPEFGERFWVYQIVDLRTDSFANLGKMLSPWLPLHRAAAERRPGMNSIWQHGGLMANDPKERVTADSASDHISVELGARRTGMSFQRTRMSADRTLMSVIRTSLSLIGFGFTISQIFRKAHEAGMLKSSDAAHNFGIALVALGIAMLVVGIAYHVVFMADLRRQREQMRADGLVHAESVFPLSLTLMTAFVLLVIGILAIVSIAFGIGPFE